MTAIRCPKCKLINKEEARRCRRCSTPLSLKTEEMDHKSRISGRAVGYMVVTVIALSALCIYGFYGNSKSAASSVVGVSGTTPGINNKAVATSGTPVITPVNKELEEVKVLHRDFIAKFDQNAADRKGEGLKKNQALAYDTLIMLRGKQTEIFEASAQKYLDDFSKLVQQYYNQAVKYNSESVSLVEVNNRARSEVEQIRKDPSLTQEEKTIRISHIVKDDDSEFQRAGVNARDIDETVKSIRDLSKSDARQQ